MDGILITFEGIEGCGKSTQIKMFSDYLSKAGLDVVLTREPGGTAVGEKIRDILLDPMLRGITPIAELLLYAAARHQHLAQVIRPVLDAGKVVLCDRYADATTAYQGAARRIDKRVIEAVHRIATEGLMPRLTIVLDCPSETGLQRARLRNITDPLAAFEDRFEQEDMKFHERVRQAYLAIARAEPDRVVVIDATKDIETTHKDIVNLFFRLFKNVVQTHRS